MTPIWKDKPFDAAAYLVSGSVDYVVKVDGTTIYTGRAYADPQGSCTIIVNDIVSTFLKQTFPETTIEAAAVEVAVNVETANGTVIGSETFTYDWSYTNDNRVFLSRPIVPKADTRAPMVFTAKESFSIDADGYTETFTLTEPSNCMYNPDIDDSKVTVNGVVIEMSHKCDNRFVVYYVNPWGGWDSFLMEGKYDEITDYDRDTITTFRRKIELMNEGTKRFTLRTGWLTDVQSNRMYELVGSPNIYVYDMQYGKMYPAVITDTNCETRTFAITRKPVQYALNVELAETFIRK